MKIQLPILTALFFTAQLSSMTSSSNERFTGLWQGQHPEFPHASFIIHIHEHGHHLLQAEGYWLIRNIVHSTFRINSCRVHENMLNIRMDPWKCTYSGRLSENRDKLIGQFDCAGEMPDSVELKKVGENEVFGLFNKSPDENEIVSFHNLQSGMSKMDSSVLREIIREILTDKYGKIHSFLLYRNNQLVCEEYFYGFHSDVLHPVESVTKSIVSLLIGQLKDQDLIGSLDTPVSVFFKSEKNLHSADLKKIHLSHLLTMASGIQSDPSEILFAKDRKQYLLSCKSSSDPGAGFTYQNWNTEMLGLIIKETSSLYSDQYAELNLFNQLDIHSYQWDLFRNDGYPLCGGSLWLRPVDMGKIGLLVLNKGKWKGKQLVSKKWISASTSSSIETGIDSDQYGYHWWVSQVFSGNSAFNVIWANGMGSQFIFILPELDMVMVTTGGNWEGGDDGSSWDIFKMLERHLFRFVKNGD